MANDREHENGQADANANASVNVSLSAGRLWDDAASPAIADLTHQFESAWREALAGKRGAARSWPSIEPFLERAADQRSSALLALLRTEMALRHDEGEAPRAESCFRRYPELTAEAKAALVYEEFCLREEAGETIAASDYYKRFPDLADRLRRILEIHELLEPSSSRSHSRSFSNFLGSLGSLSTESAPSPGANASGPPELSNVNANANANTNTESAANSNSNERSPQGTSSTKSPKSSKTRSPRHFGRSLKFPKTGERIAEFELEEEIGAGSFARVFLASDSGLANRQVAVKVARAGSREDKILARLQHTHIVPIYSAQDDPKTGFHLICMPYLGRVTLGQLLADPEARGPERSGAGLLRALDRLQPRKESHVIPEIEGVDFSKSSVRKTIEKLSHDRAVAWWMARLAEALQHAHDRGIMHRDIKPSNILVTRDALPMLLDFNLASDCRLDDAEFAERLGGTVAYMAPEHLDAIGWGGVDRIDGRADIYALGVVLYEAIAGQRPFSVPKQVLSAVQALRRTSEERRRGPIPLRSLRPDAPRALAAIVHRCLAGDPDQRYAQPSELAQDLQAFADDRRLSFAREPIASRSSRWVRHHGKRLAVAIPAAIAIGAALIFFWRWGAEVEREIDMAFWAMAEGNDHLDRRDYRVAREFFDLATGRPPADSDAPLKIEQYERKEAAKRRRRLGLREIHQVAAERRVLAEQGFQAEEMASELRMLMPWARLAFLNPERGQLAETQPKLDALARKLSLKVRDGQGRESWNRIWIKHPKLALLSASDRDRVIADVEQWLFLQTIETFRGGKTNAGSALARPIIEAGLGLERDQAPWKALKAWTEEAPESAPPIRDQSAMECFLWGVLRLGQDRPEEALPWLEAAATLDEKNAWHHYQLAALYERLQEVQSAERHFHLAAVLEPDWPWPHNDLARLRLQRGDSEEALRDVKRAMEKAAEWDAEYPEAHRQLGEVLKAMGRFTEARAELLRLLPKDQAAGPWTVNAREALADLAELDWVFGADGLAKEEAERLLGLDPNHRRSRFLLARIALQSRRFRDADDDLTRLLGQVAPREGMPAHPEDRRWAADIWQLRALERIAAGHPAEAVADARRACRADRRRDRERVLDRALLAADQPEEVVLDRLEDFQRMPDAGRAKAKDLSRGARRLGELADQGRDAPETIRWRNRQAAMLLAVGESDAAERAVRQGVAKHPDSSLPRLALARVLLAMGRHQDAADEADQALRWEPTSLPVLEVRGRARLAMGDFDGAIRDLEPAAAPGDIWTYQALAAALERKSRWLDARKAWENARSADPADPELALSCARMNLKLQLWDRAAADLELAAESAWNNAEILTRIVEMRKASPIRDSERADSIRRRIAALRANPPSP